MLALMHPNAMVVCQCAPVRASTMYAHRHTHARQMHMLTYTHTAEACAFTHPVAL